MRCRARPARRLIAPAPSNPGNRHHQRQRQREAQRELAQLTRSLSPSFQRPERFSASTTSGGMYFSSCLARTSVALKVPLGVQRAGRHHALAFAEQSRQHAVEIDRHGARAVGHHEAHIRARAMMHAGLFHQAADAERDAGLTCLAATSLGL